ncbi:MAG: hypothetical protein KME17_04735 [Cyanosarcina radialis HA8281-LM2]|nr:hypothetical protein [Cyanosarcina radialis HA8281-LM2]
MSGKFFVDRGGTFTDIVAISPKNRVNIHKSLPKWSQSNSQ